MQPEGGGGEYVSHTEGWRGLYRAIQAARRWWRRVCILYLRLEGPIWSCTGSQKGKKERVEDSMYLIPEAGGVYSICSCTGSQKGEEERVEDSMYLIPEAGGAYMELYRQQEGGEGEGGGQYVSNTLCGNISEAGGVYRICSSTGSQKGEEERVKVSMYLIPEAGVVYRICSCTGSQKGEEERVVDSMYLIPEAGGVYCICSCTGSQKGEEDSVEDSMYLILEAGMVYMKLYMQPEGGGGEYVSYTWGCRGLYRAKQAARGWWRRVCILYMRLEGPIWICTGSQKGEKERVEDSMYLIPEAGGVYSIYSCAGS
jgi:hypothetical protein